MKKTLALLLALTTVLTISLASCKKQEEDPEGELSDFTFDMPSGDESGDSSNKVTEESGNIVNSSDFVTASGTAYILHPVLVRKDAKNSSSTIGTAAWGSAVTLKERNSTWSKVEFTDNGIKLEGYVRNELLTTDKTQVTEKALETPVAAKIANLGTKSDGTAYTLNVRTTPWDSSKSNEYKNINVLSNIGNQKYEVKDGDVVEKIATTEDGKWTRIRFTKTVDGTETVEWGWCSSAFVKVEGETVENPGTTPDAPPTIGAIK